MLAPNLEVVRSSPHIGVLWEASHPHPIDQTLRHRNAVTAIAVSRLNETDAGTILFYDASDWRRDLVARGLTNRMHTERRPVVAILSIRQHALSER